jgi:hypothetical protein
MMSVRLTVHMEEGDSNWKEFREILQKSGRRLCIYKHREVYGIKLEQK